MPIANVNRIVFGKLTLCLPIFPLTKTYCKLEAFSCQPMMSGTPASIRIAHSDLQAANLYNFEKITAANVGQVAVILFYQVFPFYNRITEKIAPSINLRESAIYWANRNVGILHDE